LIVWFSNGGIYQYYDVKAIDFYQLMVSRSIGRQFVQQIRNRHRYVLLYMDRPNEAI
jgi:hypothetical protein